MTGGRPHPWAAYLAHVKRGVLSTGYARGGVRAGTDVIMFAREVESFPERSIVQYEQKISHYDVMVGAR